MHKHTIWLGLAVTAAVSWPAGAQDNERALERLEITMTLLPEQARDAAEITRRIELPPAAEAGNRERAENAGDAGQQGRDAAAEARERGRDFGQQVAEDARANRESADRGGGPPDGVPGGPPSDPPGRPDDVPGPPANPGRP